MFSKSIFSCSFEASRCWPWSSAYSLLSRLSHWLSVQKTVLKELQFLQHNFATWSNIYTASIMISVHKSNLRLEMTGFQNAQSIITLRDRSYLLKEVFIYVIFLCFMSDRSIHELVSHSSSLSRRWYLHRLIGKATEVKWYQSNVSTQFHSWPFYYDKLPCLRIMREFISSDISSTWKSRSYCNLTFTCHTLYSSLSLSFWTSKLI